MFRILVVLCVSALAAATRSSPHADNLQALLQTSAHNRISDNILEDASLDVPGLISKYRYPVEVHNLTTEDGYILEMHRIPHGRDNNNDPTQKRPVVFLMHGLLSSSADWVLMGPGCAFAYILAEAGFDVWMGNVRGNYYSRRHVRYNPNAIFNTKFWEYSWDEIGNIDVPSMIDYALEKSNQKRLHYVGHSQGTTAFFVMASMKPEYNAKVTSMHAYAPVAYMAHNRSLMLNFLSLYARKIEAISGLVGFGEFMPNSELMTWAGYNLCMDEIAFQPMCSNIVFLLGGWSRDQHNATMLPLKLAHTPAGGAVRQFAHYGQGIADKQFRRYDFGRITNRRKYGRYTPPSYDLSKITTPVLLHYSASDPLAHVNDVDRLFAELGRPVGKFRIALPNFSHADFVWAIDAKTLLYDRTINLINTLETQARIGEMV